MIEKVENFAFLISELSKEYLQEILIEINTFKDLWGKNLH